MKDTKTKTKPTPKRKAGTPPNTTRVFFLLDRSGSMSACLEETISGFNSYLDGLSDQGLLVTLVQFDTQGIETVFADKVPSAANRLTKNTYRPRGGTPLWDAFGHTIAQAKSAKGPKDKVLFVTLTDGKENASISFSAETIREMIKALEKEGWTFAHIGVGLEGWNAVTEMAFGTQSASNIMHTTNAPGDVKATYERVAFATRAVGQSVGAKSVNVNWTGDKDLKGKKK